MVSFLLKLISLIPLPALHRIGDLLGRAAYALGTNYRTKMTANIRQAGLDPERLLPEVKRHSGMQAMEIPWVWKRSNADLMRHVTLDQETVDRVRGAVSKGRPVIFMTPHIGCFEVAPVAYEALTHDFGKRMTVLYREPKMPFLRPFVAASRTREGMDPVPADLSGVRQLVRALRAGGVLGCLPDQVPGHGEGVWVPFFGRLAFTMTLPVRMARQFDAVRIIAWSVRTPGQGWKVCVTEWDDPLTGDLEHDAALMNKALEKAIMQAPEQYAWSYNRYKCPAGVKRPKGGKK